MTTEPQKIIIDYESYREKGVLQKFICYSCTGFLNLKINKVKVSVLYNPRGYIARFYGNLKDVLKVVVVAFSRTYALINLFFRVKYLVILKVMQQAFLNRPDIFVMSFNERV